MLRRRSNLRVADQVATEEAFRILRSSLTVALTEIERPSVLITSALPGEGKTSTCANLARAMAVTGQRIVAVDVDLRQPRLHQWLGGHNEVGISDVLLERAPLAEALQRIEFSSGNSRTSSLYMIAAGSQAHSPTELLATGRLGRLLEALSAQADLVLLDSAPVLPVADTLVIGRYASGAVLVVEAHRTPVTAVQRAKDALTRNQTRLLGLILNKAEHDELEYGYGYGYGSSYAGTSDTGDIGSVNGN